MYLVAPLHGAVRHCAARPGAAGRCAGGYKEKVHFSPEPPLARHPAFTSAVTCALIVFLMTFLGGLATPGYSHVSQFISELGASQAAFEIPVRYLGFLPAGYALLAFCWFAHRDLPKSGLTTAALIGLAVYAFGYCVASSFPCDPGCRPAQPSGSQVLHNLLGGIGYVVAPGFLGVLATRARSWPAARALSALGFAAAALALLGLLTLSPASPYVGLSQRAIEVAVLGWVLACGWYIQGRALVAAA